MALFRDYDMVRLKRDLAGENLMAGALGAVVMVFSQDTYPHFPQAYEVEFLDAEGEPSTESFTLTLLEEELETATAA